MTAWTYRAVRADGRLVRGGLEAASERDAASRLRLQGLAPLALAVQREPAPVRAAALSELAVFFRAIATLSGAGLPLSRALLAAEGMVPARLSPVLRGCRERLAEGESLSSALGASSQHIPPDAIALLRAGERAGRLEATLVQLAEAFEATAIERAQLVQALAYPAVLATGGLISLVVVVFVILPKFAAMLADFGQQLPPATAMLLVAANALKRWWLAIVGVGIVFEGAAASLLAREEYLVRWQEVLLDAPGLGAIRTRRAASRGLRTLAGALASGMSLRSALAVAAEAGNDRAYCRRVRAAAALVEEGTALTAALIRCRAVPGPAAHLLGIGEGSGRLAELARKASDLLAAENQRAMQSFVRLLEPVLIIVLGGGVALVAGALLQAVYGLRPGA